MRGQNYINLACLKPLSASGWAARCVSCRSINSDGIRPDGRTTWVTRLAGGCKRTSLHKKNCLKETIPLKKSAASLQEWRFHPSDNYGIQSRITILTILKSSLIQSAEGGSTKTTQDNTFATTLAWPRTYLQVELCPCTIKFYLASLPALDSDVVSKYIRSEIF